MWKVCLSRHHEKFKEFYKVLLAGKCSFALENSDGISRFLSFFNVGTFSFFLRQDLTKNRKSILKKSSIGIWQPQFLIRTSGIAQNFFEICRRNFSLQIFFKHPQQHPVKYKICLFKFFFLTNFNQ